MLPLQVFCRFPHGRKIQRLRNTGHILSVKYIGVFAVPNGIAVGLFLGIEPGMKPGRTILAPGNTDILRQVLPQLCQNLFGRHGAFTMEICHLSHRMHTGIGATAAGNLDLLAQDLTEAGLQFALDGVVLSRQPLPATIAGAVVANIKANVAHGFFSPLLAVL